MTRTPAAANDWDAKAVQALLEGRSVVFDELGSLRPRHYPGYVGRDPRTGAEIPVPEQTAVSFESQLGKGLKRPSPLGPEKEWAFWGKHGLFRILTKPGRSGTDSQTGETITLPAREIVAFRPSRWLLAALNSKPADEGIAGQAAFVLAQQKVCGRDPFQVVPQVTPQPAARSLLETLEAIDQGSPAASAPGPAPRLPKEIVRLLEIWGGQVTGTLEWPRIGELAPAAAVFGEPGRWPLCWSSNDDCAEPWMVAEDATHGWQVFASNEARGVAVDEFLRGAIFVALATTRLTNPPAAECMAVIEALAALAPNAFALSRLLPF